MIEIYHVLILPDCGMLVINSLLILSWLLLINCMTKDGWLAKRWDGATLWFLLG